MFCSVSFLRPSGRGMVENAIIGGCALTQLKKEKGARLLFPARLRLPTQAMGRGAIAPMRSLYMSEWGSAAASSSMREPCEPEPENGEDNTANLPRRQ